MDPFITVDGSMTLCSVLDEYSKALLLDLVVLLLDDEDAVWLDESSAEGLTTEVSSSLQAANNKGRTNEKQQIKEYFIDSPRLILVTN